MLCVAAVVVTAADAVLCAEQTLTAPAVAAIMIAALSCFVNFILITFLVVGYTKRSGVESHPEARLLRIRSGWLGTPVIDLENRVTRCLSEGRAPQALQPG